MDIRESIVGIIAKGSGHKYAGTGFFVSGGLILTCAHVVDGARVLKDWVLFTHVGADIWLLAEVIFKSEATELDIAILKPVDAENARPNLRLVTSRECGGDEFASFGYPLEGSGDGLHGVGKILGEKSDSLGRSFLQISSNHITHGFSGCPVYDEQAGGVVGMVSSGFDFGLDKKLGDIAFAIPSEVLKYAWPDLRLDPAERLKTTFSAPHQLPAAPRDFTGRDGQIEALLADFDQTGGAAIIGLTGMGGVGKTTLGLVLAHKLKDQYPDGQVFIDLQGTTAPMEPEEAMRQIILSFEPETDLRGLNEQGIAAAYQTVLTGKKVLVFLDNASEAAQMQALLPPEGCGLLVTSRWNFPLPGLKTYHLGMLEPEETKGFLVKLCERIGGQAGELARLCGYLPLALRLAGSFLAVNENVDVANYIKQLDARRLEGLKQAHDDSGSAEPEVAATFNLSYECLTEDKKKAWRELEVFPDSFTGEAAAAVWQMETEAAESLLRRLCRYSLLEDDPHEKRYRLHDLLGEFARGYLTEQERFEVELQHASYFVDIPWMADELYKLGKDNILKGLQLLDREWNHVVAGQAWAVRNFEASDDIARLCSRYMGNPYCLDLRLDPHEKINWLNKALDASKILNDRSAEGAHLTNLGLAYADLGEVRKAIEFYEQSLSIDREIGNELHSKSPGEITTLTNLGNAWATLDEARKAIDFYEQSLSISREIGNRREEGAVLGNLGVVYQKLGEVHKGIEFIEKYLTITREIGDRDGEGIALGNLGRAYHKLGETRKAIDFYEQSLSIKREIGDRRGEGKALGSLGNAYYSLGETGKAIDFYEQALVIFREIGGRTEEGIVLRNLGDAYNALGETSKAEEYQKQAKKIKQELEELNKQK